MSTIYNSKLIIAVLVGAFLAASFSVFAYTRDNSSYRGDTVEQYDHYTLITESVESATSSALEIANAEKVQVYFTRNDASPAGATTTFSLQVSPDGTNWYDYSKIVSNTTNTNSQDLTRVASVEIVGATSTTMAAMDMQFEAFHSLRCIAVNAATTSDSNATCEVSVRE